MIVTFTNTLISGSASVTSGVGSVAAPPTLSGHTMAIDLTGVADRQTIAVSLSNITDSLGESMPDSTLIMGLLPGDTNGDSFVNSGDAQQTRNRSGQLVDMVNFRSDLNADGSINSGDSFRVRARSGDFLPGLPKNRSNR